MSAKPYRQIRSELAARKITCIELVKYYLEQIKRHSEINAFIEVFEDSALAKAAAVDAKIKAGNSGKLAGMIIGIKDNICYQGHKVGASSHILEGFTSPYSATVVERILAEDAIIIGRLGCDEFAMGSSNETSYYGKIINPHNHNYVPGGSSGGSAAAVAAGLCMAALGSDTGGSIRQPASFCGNVGLKPTYGRVSRWGLLAYASSFDQIGPITTNVYDAALLLEVMAGPDEYDSTASNKQTDKYSDFKIINKKYKIAYLKETLESTGLDNEVKTYSLGLLEKLQSEGHQVEAVEFPLLQYLVPAYYVLTTAEASSNLSRYDGIRFGYRAGNAEDIETVYKKSRSQGFGKEVKRRIMLGTFVLSAGYYDAYYTKGLKTRQLIRKQTLDILKQYDFIFTPTTPSTAFEFGKKSDDPVAMYLEDIFTVQANLAGIPAISLPMGKHSNGLPFGVQLMSAPFTEHDLLSFSAHLVENY
jgi:aspartyl-tRNA(Asn)/glutamyl-tRNA(Gln) amidotransferase subunit A